MNTKTFGIWCYLCDDSVIPSCSKKLHECVEIIKKEAQRPLTTTEIINDKDTWTDNKTATWSYSSGVVGDTLANNAIVAGSSIVPQIMERGVGLFDAPQPRARGLTNLGNTCFFNSVVQCLAQTPFLLRVLKESSEPGEKFRLPGGTFTLTEGTDVDLEPITGELNSWGNLTSSLADAIEELNLGGGVYTPKKLFNQLTTKWRQFAGGDQHDSHELLRHLLESVRSEDLRRYQSVILRSLNFDSKVDPSTVEGDMKKKIKFYGQQAADRILRPEPVFRGFLVSTLTCQDCYHTSSRHESFLDISLPVSVEKPQPPIRRKNSPEPSSTTTISTSSRSPPTLSASGSKHQTKKERERERKLKRQQKNQNKKISLQAAGGDEISAENLDDTNVANNEDSTNQSSITSSSSEPSDADVEDNVTDDHQQTKKKMANNVDANGNPKIANVSEKCDESPENLNKEKTEDKGDDEELNMKPLLDDDDKTEEKTKAVEAEVIELTISAEGFANLMKNRKLGTTAGSGDAEPVIDDLEENFENLTFDEREKLRKQRKLQQQKRQRTISHVDWSTTIAPRYHCEDGECSVQSCLNNFTAVEYMTGNNKVSCEACTERINGKDGKSVNTNATKQFLISSPPAVLILHLKRFQVGPRCMFRKITKPVTFPFILDIAPFCGSKVKRLPNICPHQKKLLYSLYGIVEHSGSMHGGHYIAYVKVRPRLNDQDTRWSYLPKGSKAELDQNDEQRIRLEETLAKAKAVEMGLATNDSDDSSTTASEEEVEGAIGGSDDGSNVKAPPGKWYYISDSHVKEVSEEYVMNNAQAYLLFYERIY